MEEESGPIGGGGDVDEDGDDRMGVRGGGGVRGRGGGGVGGQKGRKLDKGYIGLLDDCIGEFLDLMLSYARVEDS